MKIIIAGSRDITDARALDLVMDEFCKGVPLTSITEIVSGGARGVDQLGVAWAQARKLPIKLFLPDWERFGPAAGPRRNFEMGTYADVLVCLWDGKSKGSKHMQSVMDKLTKLMYVVDVHDLPG